MTARFKQARKSNMTNIEDYHSKVSNLGADLNFISAKIPQEH